MGEVTESSSIRLAAKYLGQVKRAIDLQEKDSRITMVRYDMGPVMLTVSFREGFRLYEFKNSGWTDRKTIATAEDGSVVFREYG